MPHMLTDLNGLEPAQNIPHELRTKRARSREHWTIAITELRSRLTWPGCFDIQHLEPRPGRLPPSTTQCRFKK